MSTPAQVAEWLRNNIGNLTDAYKAVGYEGKPLKIKEGNLTNKRSQIRLAIRGENGDLHRRAAERLNPPQNKKEQNQNRRQNYKRSSLRKAGKNVVIDHKHDLKLLAQTVDGMTPQQAQAEIKRLEQSYGPLGNRPGNRQIVGAKFNELKRQGSEKLQQHLGKLELQDPRVAALGMSKPPQPKTKPKSKTTKTKPKSKPSRTLRFGSVLGSSSGSEIVDRVNGKMHLTAPHLADLGFEFF